jgi:hypothetical protein
MSTTIGHMLDEAIERGDIEAVTAALREIPRGQRASLAPALRERARVLREQDDPQVPWEDKQPQRDREFATGAALFVCGTARDAAGAFLRADDAAALAREFDPPSLEGLGEAMMALPRVTLNYLNPFIESGLVPRPDDEAHTQMMMDLPTYAGWAKKVSMEAYVQGDPTLHDVILRVMEIEGTSDASLASVDKYRRDAWSIFFASPWSQSHFGRDLLLDKTLDALEKDWPQFRSGWFSRFHERLGPTPDELGARLPRYLALCRSRIPPTVGLALKALEKIDASVSIQGHDLLDALAPVMHAAAKEQVESAMKLAERRLRVEPALADQVARLLVDALGHADAGVQAKAIKRLSGIALDDTLRATLATYLPGIAASNRPALATLVGLSPAVERQPVDVLIETTKLPEPCDASRELPRIDDADTLAERVAYVFANDTDIDAFEAVLAALTRMAPLGATVRARLAPVAKRLSRQRKPIAQALAQVVAMLLDLPAPHYARMVDNYDEHADIDLQVLHRVVDTVATARHGAGLEPLDAATHRGGFIDPGRLAQRIAAHGAAGMPWERRTAVRALLRLPSAAPMPDEFAALPASSLRQAFGHALGGALDPGEPDSALMAAAARIRHPGADDPLMLARLGDLGPDTTRAPVISWHIETRQSQVDGKTYTFHDFILDDDCAPEGADPLLIALHRHQPSAFKPRYASHRWGYAGIDEALVRYSATLLPSCMDTFFAGGCRLLGNNLGWYEAQWQNRAYLFPLLEPTVTPGPMGTLLLALALAGKEPGQTALAVDGLVQSSLEGRIDLNRLGTDMSTLLASDHVLAARYAKALAAAARTAPGMLPVVTGLLEVLIGARPEDPPRDTSALLALLHESLLESGGRIGENTRSVLPSLKLSGRGAALRKALLA